MKWLQIKWRWFKYQQGCGLLLKMRNNHIYNLFILRTLCTPLPRRALEIILQPSFLWKYVLETENMLNKCKVATGMSHFGKIKTFILYTIFNLFLLGRTPDYLKAHVHFISRFRRGLLGSTLLDELPERWHSVKRTLSVCKIETIAQLQHNFGMNKYLSAFKVFRPWHCITWNIYKASVFKAASVYP